MWLTPESFRSVVNLTPLVSIDLIIENSGKILLGRRLNRPAKGFWFAPGGRILKNENMDSAFQRITYSELGYSFNRAEAKLLNAYEHFYKDSIFGDSENAPNTHYVVLGYHLQIPETVNLNLPDKQHDRYHWWTAAEIQSSLEVHHYTKAYLLALR